MAVTVAFDGTRLHDTGTTTTGWTGFGTGATPTIEPDFVYQGSASISVKVKTTAAGCYFTSTPISFASPKRIWLAKVIATTKDGLDGNGFSLRLGADISNYWRYDIFTSATYPAAGGWQIVALDPNVAYTRTVGAGSPAASSIGLYGVEADFGATAKAENVAIDAIDYMTNGTGLTLTTSASSIGTFADFLAADEGTASGRWGIVASRGGILYVTGVLTIGTSGTEGDFDDTGAILVFPAHLVDTGFCGIDFNVQNAATVIAVRASVLKGRGVQATADTRPDYTVIGTSGTLDLIGVRFDVFRQIDLTAAATVSGCIFIDGRRILQVGATIEDSFFSGCTGGDGVAFLLSDNPGLISGCGFTFSDGHAIECATPGSYNFVDNTFTGYGADGSTDAAFWNNCTPTTQDSYSESNQDTDQDLYAGGITKAAQTFTTNGSGGELSVVRFYLRKTGSPTGTAVVKVYATTAGAPTGTALATSETLDVSTLSTSFALVAFEFQGDQTITLAASTVYAVSIEYAGGDASNRVEVGQDASSPTHTGTKYTE